MSVVKLLCWQHQRVRAADAIAFTTRNSAVQSAFLARAPSCVAIVSACTSDEPLVLVVDSDSSLAQGDSAVVASTILLGPDRLLSPSTAILANTPSAVVRRCCRCGRQTVQLHSCAAFRYLLVEPSVTQSIQALASLFSVRAT